jgi:hypothetical protein
VFDVERAAEVLVNVLAARAAAGAAMPASLVVAVAGPVERAAYRAALGALGAAR